MSKERILLVIYLTAGLLGCAKSEDRDQAARGNYYSPDVSEFFQISQDEQRVFGEKTSVVHCNYDNLVYCAEGHLPIYLPRFPIHFIENQISENNITISVNFSIPTFSFCDQMVSRVIVRSNNEVISYIFSREKGLVGFTYQELGENRSKISAYLIDESDLNYFDLICGDSE